MSRLYITIAICLVACLTVQAYHHYYGVNEIHIYTSYVAPEGNKAQHASSIETAACHNHRQRDLPNDFTPKPIECGTI
jgi:hypothetical protein